MPHSSSPKQEQRRQRIKDTASKSGQERTRAGRVPSADSGPVKDTSSPRRVGRRSRTGADGRTYDELYVEARRRHIQGRSTMRKAELQKALSH